MLIKPVKERAGIGVINEIEPTIIEKNTTYLKAIVHLKNI